MRETFQAFPRGRETIWEVFYETIWARVIASQQSLRDTGVSILAARYLDVSQGPRVSGPVFRFSRMPLEGVPTLRLLPLLGPQIISGGKGCEVCRKYSGTFELHLPRKDLCCLCPPRGPENPGNSSRSKVGRKVGQKQVESIGISDSTMCILGALQRKEDLQRVFVKIVDFIQFKGFFSGISKEQALLRKSKAPRKSPEKRTFLSLAFCNAPSLHTVNFCF